MPPRWTDEFARALAEILNAPGVTPDGAYAAGVVTTMVWSECDELPTVDVLRAASTCTSVRQAVAFGKACVRRTHAKQRRRAGAIMRRGRKEPRA